MISKRPFTQCVEIVQEEHFKYSPDEPGEIVGSWVEKRQCRCPGKYKFSDKKILCRAHAGNRLLREAADRCEVIALHRRGK